MRRDEFIWLVIDWFYSSHHRTRIEWILPLFFAGFDIDFQYEWTIEITLCEWIFFWHFFAFIIYSRFLVIFGSRKKSMGLRRAENGDFKRLSWLLTMPAFPSINQTLKHLRFYTKNSTKNFNTRKLWWMFWLCVNFEENNIQLTVKGQNSQVYTKFHLWHFLISN